MDDGTEGHIVIDSMINKLKFTTCGPMDIMYFNSNEDDNNYNVSIYMSHISSLGLLMAPYIILFLVIRPVRSYTSVAKHDIALKILHLASLELARQAAINCYALRYWQWCHVPLLCVDERDDTGTPFHMALEGIYHCKG